MEPTTKKMNKNPLFPFMTVGSLIYAFFYTFCLYKNASGITYPFFVGGTCLFFFCYLKRSAVTAKKFSVYITISLLLLGISTCCTDSWILLFFNKTAILFLFFYLMLHNIYEDKKWDISKYMISILNTAIFSLSYIYKPFEDFFLFCKEKTALKNKSAGKIKYVFFGILAALPMLIVIVLLLGSADAVFFNLLKKVFSFDNFFHIFENVWGILFLFTFAFFASYCLMYRLKDKNIKEEIIDRRRLEPIMGITVTSMFSVVYLVFCFIQIVYLFGGFGSLPEGYTYASYAREGFFQLVFVCLINLVLVLICMKYFREHIILKLLLTFICLCTFIMIASSAYRMILYITVYHLTFLRLFVLWALIVISFLICGAIALIFNQNFPLLKYFVIVISSLYIIFSYSHPDYLIARYNLDKIYIECRDEQNGNIFYTLSENRDFYYLKRLSADAAPAIFKKSVEIQVYPEEENPWFDKYAASLVADSYSNKALFPIEEHLLPKNQSFRQFNFSKRMAYKVYREYFKTHPAFAERIGMEIYHL